MGLFAVGHCGVFELTPPAPAGYAALGFPTFQFGQNVAPGQVTGAYLTLPQQLQQQQQQQQQKPIQGGQQQQSQQQQPQQPSSPQNQLGPQLPTQQPQQPQQQPQQPNVPQVHPQQPPTPLPQRPPQQPTYPVSVPVPVIQTPQYFEQPSYRPIYRPVYQPAPVYSPVPIAQPIAVPQPIPVATPVATPVAVAPVPVYANAHPHYQFHYGVSDPLTGDNKSQEESRDGDVVKGQYTLLQPDGITRIVYYTADNTGFHAQVTYSGPGVHPQPQKPVAVAVAPVTVVKPIQPVPAFTPGYPPKVIGPIYH